MLTKLINIIGGETIDEQVLSANYSLPMIATFTGTMLMQISVTKAGAEALKASDVSHFTEQPDPHLLRCMYFCTNSNGLWSSQLCMLPAGRGASVRPGVRLYQDLLCSNHGHPWEDVSTLDICSSFKLSCTVVKRCRPCVDPTFSQLSFMKKGTCS